MKKLLSILLGIALLPIVNWFTEIDNATPEHCGRKAEFIGSHTSLFEEKLFYQCPVCKKMFAISNPHEGIPLMHLWRLIFWGGFKCSPKRLK